MSSEPELLRKLAAHFLEALAEGGSRIAEMGAFRLHVWPTPHPFYRNVAVPVRPAADWPAALAELRQQVAEHGCAPRLEFFADLWPDLTPALDRAGFTTDMQATVMAAAAPAVRAAPHLPAPGEVRFLDAATPPSTLIALFVAAAEAFAEPGLQLGAAELARLRAGLACGAIQLAAVFRDGVPVSAASLIGQQGVGEIVAVWTAQAHRRQGLASRTCAMLTARFGAVDGHLVWLSAADPGSVALYSRLGFQACGTQIHASAAQAAVAEEEVAAAGRA